MGDARSYIPAKKPDVAEQKGRWKAAGADKPDGQCKRQRVTRSRGASMVAGYGKAK